MPDRKHMADEIELHIERRIPVWNCAGGQSPWTHIQRHLPPVIDQRHVRHADLADDLGPHMQGVACCRPFVHHQGWPAVAPRGVVHVVAPPAPHSHSWANSSLPEAAAPCRYQYAQTRWPFASAVNNSAVAMSDITQPIATGPNQIDPWQRWYGLLPSLVGAEGGQDGPLIP